MIEYLGAEYYKLVRRKYLYILFGVIAAGELLLIGLWRWSASMGNPITFGSGLELGVNFFSMGLYLSLLLSDLVFSEQYKSGTLKNEVSAGISRGRIYLGKLLSAELLGALFCAAVLIWYAVVCRVLLPAGDADRESLVGLGFALLCALPLWMGALGLANLLFFLMRSNTVAAFSFVAFLWLYGGALNLLTFVNHPILSKVASALYRISLTAPFDHSLPSSPDWAFFGWCLAVGLGWLAVTTAVGLPAFRKREIN